MRLFLYDTTLRDGAQRAGLSFSVEDKLKVARMLDEFGVPYIEGGWPGANPKDIEFFRRAKLKQARLVAFGMTRSDCLDPLLEADTPTVALVGKSSLFHVRRVLGVEPHENLNMIADCVRRLKAHGREVVYDAEHFFDGYREDPHYAAATLEAAAEAGADWLVLCDTNGGSLPDWIAEVGSALDLGVPLGIHTHNDGELAVANSLAAVECGCTMLQGTINGYGERCGNANLVSLLPTLQLKLGYDCVSDLSKLTDLSRTISEIANENPDPYAPFVGSAAFTHKGGIHAAAVGKETTSYEHLEPELIGNVRGVVVSELAGRGNVRALASSLGFAVNDRQVLELVKKLEHQGYQFEGAEGSFELLVRRLDHDYRPPFEVLDTKVFTDGYASEAVVKVRVQEDVVHTAAEGDGPVHALDQALRKALLPSYPQLADVRLADYKVRILDSGRATKAVTRVLIEATSGDDRWSTLGCSQNIIQASCQALTDSLELPLSRRCIERLARPA